MRENFYKNIFFQIIFLIIIITQIKSEEDILEERRPDDKENEDEDERPDMMKVLEDLKEEIQNLNRDITKYDTLIYMLVPISCLLFLILLGFSVYEIIKCCKNKDGDLNETTKNGNYLHSENINNSKLKNSSTDSSSPRESQDKEVKNSFHSSKVTESLVSKDVLKSDVFNSRKEKEKEVGNESNYMNIENSGYVAPPIEVEKNHKKNNNEKEKFLTNKGDDEPDKKKNKIIPNPFLK